MSQHVDIVTSPDGPSAGLLETEWLLTNGRGSFAAGTVVGANSRKYHGLMVAAVSPHSQPGERAVLLSNVIEEIKLGSEWFPLSCFEFSGAFHPRGDRFLVAFDCDKSAGCVTWTYQLGQARLVKRFALARGSDTIALRYELSGVSDSLSLADCRLRVSPLLAYRHYHGNRAARGDPAAIPEWDGDFLRLHDPAGQLPAMRFELPRIREQNLARAWNPVDPPPVLVVRARLEFNSSPDWWRRFFYRLEAERGEGPWEDLFTPGRFDLAFEPDWSAEIHAAVEPAETISFARVVASQRDHHARLLDVANAHDSAASPFSPRTEGPGVPRRTEVSQDDLILAGDDFVVDVPTDSGDRQVSILAGFPWFADWGRDAFISLPGLLLTTGQFEPAFGVLRRFAGAIRDGLVPNRFSDESAGCDYNSVDAALWFVHAAFAWADATGDWQRFDATLLEPVTAILTAYHDGTRFNIHADADGLLVAGDPTMQLTWMDAMVVMGKPITPRAGKPVEVNALFGHALSRVADRLDKINDPRARDIRRWWDQWSASFVAAFPSPRGGLYDFIDLDGQPNALVRPNQLLAVSLGDGPLPKSVQREVVQLATDELLTPVGLRTLARGEPGYCPQCAGSREQRDGAYHQGTVWAWLIGPFVEAYLRVNGFAATAKRQAGRWLQPLIEHMNSEACLGQISEIFDGDSPHTPRGAFAQAWSVAEVMRVMAMIR